jgi:hypothetical protein
VSFTTPFSPLTIHIWQLHVTIFFGTSLTPLTGTLSAFTANFAHMIAVLAYDLPAFAAGFTGFITTPLMGYTLAVSSTTTFAGNTTLLFRIHGGKTPVRCFPAASFIPVAIGRLASIHFILLGIAHWPETTVFLVHSALIVCLTSFCHNTQNFKRLTNDAVQQGFATK